ncbi:hypothetical protein TUM17387_23480 [Shewanella carassii]|uniref:hypothetical protein n=1 Tax=Shewanella carassii TaxID=1987584 RepID=UPI001BEFCB08|nr:hypothetical protein [Shewanella carassii]BCV66989.1 hypothetical protein TUM17387_23480 [Shewanella carassii]
MGKSLPSESELKESYKSFANFTFELLGDIASKKSNLMFAAVNSQIALELFLKYLFTAKGKVDEIRKTKKGELIDDFKDFNQILNSFYSSRSWNFGQKKEFVELMQTRNSIVHRGQKSQWDPELAKIIVKTHFFMHATAWSELGEVLLFDNYIPHKISNISVWREGVEDFCDDLADIYNCEVLSCTACKSRAVVSGEIFVLEEGHTEEYVVCLCCLSSINIEHEARLLECYKCFDRAYLIDAFNEQKNQLYIGKCSECDTDTMVRKCANCEWFYHPSSEPEVKFINKYFCSESCKECYEEVYA